MKHIRVIAESPLVRKNTVSNCGECQTSCQSACKTSCTVGNQNCENTRIRRNGSHVQGIK